MPSYKWYKAKSRALRTLRTGYGKRAVVIQRAWRRRKNANLRTQVKRLKRKVYNNLQNCWIDTIQNPVGSGAGGYINPDFCSLQQIAQGDDHDQRQGNKITVKSISIKGQMRCANGDIFNEFRVIVFSLVDDPPPGASIVVGDILQNGDLYSHYKKNSTYKYKIHWDKTYQMSNPLATVATQPTSTDLNGCPYRDFIHIEKKIKFKNGHQVWYRSPTAGVAIKGGIYMLTISDSLNQLPTGHPTFGYQIRMAYDP